jgi:hypothetical protein
MNSYNQQYTQYGEQGEDNTGMYIFIGIIILIFAVVGGVIFMFGGSIISSIKGMFNISNMLGLNKVFNPINKVFGSIGDAIDTTCTETDKGSKDINNKCTKNCECKNGACGRETAADGTPTKCCKSGKVGTYDGYSYCLDMPDGSTCWSDAQCKTGYCRGNLGGLQKGICGKLNVGEKCDIDANCKNGACGRETAADGAPKKCCKSGKVGRYSGYDYCLGMPDGSTCWSDAQCKYGNCKGNLGGLQRGKCKSRYSASQIAGWNMVQKMLIKAYKK